MNKRMSIVFSVAFAVFALSLAGCSQKTKGAGSKAVYPAGTVVIYGYGQPQYLLQYYDAWLEKNRDIAPDVKIEIVQTKGAADTREKISMTYLAGSYQDLPDAIYIDPVNLKDLAAGGMIKDETDYVKPMLSDFVAGCENDAVYKGRIYGLPDQVRPQVLFYNKAVLDTYGIDPATMLTMDGYIEAGRTLKQKSGGTVYLSYIDPGAMTWRYWGRRGLMPQANARIWGDDGSVVIGSDPGTKLAMGVLDTLYSEKLLLNSAIFQAPLYDAMRTGRIATFYIGAFWDEFIRKNVNETSGQWRVMPAPVFKEVGTGGAPVCSYFAVVAKPDGKYAGLVEKLWYDFHHDNEARKTWVRAMVEQNAPYANPITLAMFEDPFWKEPSEFYGGQSFREWEAKCLNNPSKNLAVTAQDAEADLVISHELELYVASDQTMQQAVANMDSVLKQRIGKAVVAE